MGEEVRGSAVSRQTKAAGGEAFEANRPRFGAQPRRCGERRSHCRGQAGGWLRHADGVGGHLAWRIHCRRSAICWGVRADSKPGGIREPGTGCMAVMSLRSTACPAPPGRRGTRLLTVPAEMTLLAEDGAGLQGDGPATVTGFHESAAGKRAAHLASNLEGATRSPATGSVPS